jgi:hypothetical protein
VDSVAIDPNSASKILSIVSDRVIGVRRHVARGRLSKYAVSMDVADMVYERVRRLPEPLAREVLDFVAFLQERGEREAARDLSAAQLTALSSLWDNPEDRVWDDL